MKGSYALITALNKDSKIKVGKLGLINFSKGYYAYVGSALNGLEARINRHLRKEKKLYWHLDYLLRKAIISKIFYKEGLDREECEFAKELEKKFKTIKGFGASDCKCKSHLFYSKHYPQLQSTIVKMGMNKYKSGSITKELSPGVLNHIKIIRGGFR